MSMVLLQLIRVSLLSFLFEEIWCQRNCGKSLGPDREGYVFGGEDAELGAWPWMVALLELNETTRERSVICGGFLIDKIHVVTAAHCFSPNKTSRYSAKIGHVDLRRAAKYAISDIELHQQFEKSRFYHDIALLTLSKEVNVSGFNPVCLPPRGALKNLTGRGTTVLGWGSTRKGGNTTLILKQLSSLPVVSNEYCNNIFGGRFPRLFPRGITSEMICAGFDEPGKDTCQGDSGGPLMIIEQNRWYVVGLSAFGYSCGRPDYPGVYTRVAEYLNWINEKKSMVKKSPIPKIFTPVTTTKVSGCKCGSGSTGCIFKDDGTKQCFCLLAFANKDGTCTGCNCGIDADGCRFKEDGKKECFCPGGYADRKGICTACKCGSSSIGCNFRDEEGKKECFCPPGFAENNGKCQDCKCGSESSGCKFEADGTKECMCRPGFTDKTGTCAVHNDAKFLLDINSSERMIIYFVFDISGSLSRSNFRKSVEFAKAVVKQVGISESKARAGALTFSTVATIQFYPLRYSLTESVVNALDRLNNIAEYWGEASESSVRPALRMIREDMIPLARRVFSGEQQKSIIFILTDGDVDMGGDPKREADLLKSDGAQIYCIGMTHISRRGSLYNIASDPKERYFFTAQKYASLSFLVQEITKGAIDYSECGLGLEELGRLANEKRILGSRQAPQPWPWMAGLYVNERASMRLICGASIIHKRFILTAAHCLTLNDKRKRSPADVIIKIGLTNVNNESTVQEFEVYEVITHPRFVMGTSYDYDIGLLKLKRPIVFNAFIRPICLPPRRLPLNTSLYKEDEFAVAIGWGHSGVVEIQTPVRAELEDVLKEVFLPIQSMAVCRESLENISRMSGFKISQEITDRMFCAGGGEGYADTCIGDSGGPLMQPQVNKDGYLYWTQVGVVSFGLGCRLPNTYGFYTYIQKLMSWTLNVLRS